MKIRIIGAGALGMLFAAKLANIGTEIELVTRTKEQAEFIRMQGLLLTMDADSVSGNVSEEKRKPADVTVFPAVLTFEEVSDSEINGNGNPDVIMLMVKQTSVTETLADALKRQVKPASRIVCFQNGIGHVELLKRYIAAEQLLVAVTTEGALKLTPGHAAHTGHGTTWLGAYESAKHTEVDKNLVKNIQKLLSDAGFSVFVSNNITSKVWNKLVINAVVNPLTAVLQVRNGLLAELPSTLILMRNLYDEAVMLADKLGIELTPDLWEQLLSVCRLTSNNRSSMLQDVLARRPTESEAITGGLLHKAREAGVQMPAHETMYHLVRAIEQQQELTGN